MPEGQPNPWSETTVSEEGKDTSSECEEGLDFGHVMGGFMEANCLPESSSEF